MIAENFYTIVTLMKILIWIKVMITFTNYPTEDIQFDDALIE